MFIDYWLIIYFGTGALLAFLSTVQLRLVIKRRALASSALTFFAQIINLLVLYNIIGRLTAERSFAAIVIYSLGIACGTFFALKSGLLEKKE